MDDPPGNRRSSKRRGRGRAAPPAGVVWLNKAPPKTPPPGAPGPTPAGGGGPAAPPAAWYLCIIPARYISGPRGRSSQPMARRESLSRLQSSTVSRRHLAMVSAISRSTSVTAGQP